MLSLAELSRVVRVLAPRLEGRRLQELRQPDGERLVLTLYAPASADEARRLHLLVCCAPDSARLSLLHAPPRRPQRPPAFAQYLRAHSQGARVVGLALRGGDRVAALELEAREGRQCLLLQILGRRSNAWLLGADDRVRAALRPLDATRPELSLGEPWQPPVSAPPSAGRDRFAGASDAELFAAIEAHYSESEAEGVREGLRRRLERALARDERRLGRKLEKLEGELEAARAAEELGRQGELLKLALPRLRRGDERAAVTDPASGDEVVIPLDPTRSPAENLEDLFRRQRKAVRRLSKGGAQLESLREARAGLERLREAFEAAAADPGALEELAARSEFASLLRRHEPRPQPQPGRADRPAELRLAGRRVPRRLAPRRYRTEAGLEVWVGRSDAGNDLLTTRLARGKDLFFHLDGAPGSHVVLRTEGRDDPPSEAVIDACELAVHFSKAKNASRADVHVVPIRNVRKPRGAKPGLVVVHGGRTVHLRRSPARLERVLTAKLDDP